MPSRRELANSLVTDLAARGEPDGAIFDTLRVQGLDGLVTYREIERRVLEASVANKLKSKRCVSRLFRLFGIMVLLAGILALALGSKWSIWAIICGGLLAICPEDAFEEVHLPWR